MGPFVQSQTLFSSPRQASHSLKFFWILLGPRLVVTCYYMLQCLCSVCLGQCDERKPSHVCYLLGKDHLTLTQVGRAGSPCFFSADEFFSQSCAPGADPKSSLCALCAGDDQGLGKCVPNSKEKYYGYTGAFRWVLWPGLIRTGPCPSSSRTLAHHISLVSFSL